ncbi:MAG: rod shape-determining protein RodA [Lachnospiraceae bacterium]|nr:rod shape-determining protein RodA [Lachnospiraceae bacterium]
MLRQYRIRDYDFKLIILVVALTVIGILAIGSAKESVQSRQLAGFVFGAFLMLVISLFDYSVILKFYWVLYALNIVLLTLVKLMGKEAGGAQRWLNIFGIQFQPSETAKILLILFFAQFIMKHKDEMGSLKIIGACIVLFLPPILLIYNQPDMSTSIMVVLLFCVILFVGGISWKYIILAFSVAIPAFIIALTLILQPDQTLIDDYQQSRILAWLYPEEYAQTEAYQQTNSITAIGSGMLHGKGYRTNEISSVKNGNFISEPQTDFIFAVIGEEFGFVGGCTVIVLLIFISFECIMVARRAKDIAGTIISAGVAALIGFQGMINISVATGVIPNTGIPLPFVSYGLTSLVSLYIGVGFVLNVRLQCKK